jgi:hypothetical protein
LYNIHQYGGWRNERKIDRCAKHRWLFYWYHSLLCK